MSLFIFMCVVRFIGKVPPAPLVGIAGGGGAAAGVGGGAGAGGGTAGKLC